MPDLIVQNHRENPQGPHVIPLHVKLLLCSLTCLFFVKLQSRLGKMCFTFSTENKPSNLTFEPKLFLQKSHVGCKHEAAGVPCSADGQCHSHSADGSSIERNSSHTHLIYCTVQVEAFNFPRCNLHDNGSFLRTDMRLIPRRRSLITR